MLHIQLFKALHLQQDGQNLPFQALPKVLPLWAYLLLHRERPVTRDELISLLWPEVEEARGKANLRRHLHSLRKSLPPSEEEHPWLLTQGKTLQWNPKARYWLDVVAFEKAGEGIEELERAVGLYRGALLLHLDEEWLFYERGRLEALYLNKLSALSRYYRKSGELQKALVTSQKVLEVDAFRENALCEQMLLQYATGGGVEALLAYRKFAAMLREELDTGPAEKTNQLASLIEERAPIDKLLSAFDDEIGETSIMMTSSKQRTPKVPIQLPSPLHRVFGREEEVDAILKRFTHSDAPARLLTLTGIGGVGKTRLALEVAHRLASQYQEIFPDGFFFLPLAQLVSPHQVWSGIADFFEIAPAPSSSILELLLDVLRYKRVFLLLDNFEHLLPTADALGELLRVAPGISLLVTSQEPLGLYGEQEWNLTALEYPDLDALPSLYQIEESPSVALFCEIARAANAKFQLTQDNAACVAEICMRLDGLPLAIELAASRSKIFSPQEMLPRLNDSLGFLTSRKRDLAPRHRTMRAAIQWSYDLLGDDEARLFRQLSIFASGFSVQAVAALLFGDGQESPSEDELLEKLAILTDKSLIRRCRSFRQDGKELRFELLSTLHSFAREKLQESDEWSGLKYDYIKYYASLLSHKEDAGGNRVLGPWLAQMTVEESNVHAALSSALTSESTPEERNMGACIIWSLGRFWDWKNAVDEALHWVLKALQYRECLEPLHEGRMLSLAGNFLSLRGDASEHFLPYLEEASEILRTLDEPLTLFRFLGLYGAIMNEEERYEVAEGLFSESLTLVRSAFPQEPLLLVSALSNLSTVYQNLENYERASEVLEESLALLRENKPFQSIFPLLFNLSNINRSRGHYERDRAYLHESFLLTQDLDTPKPVILCLSGAAERALLLEDFSRSTLLHSALQKHSQEANFAWPTRYQKEFYGYVNTLQKALGKERFEHFWKAGRSKTLKQVVTYALEGLQPTSPGTHPS